jgi:ubiquinone biosynthesis protein
MPKELMLFVKNMVFLDGAIATLAPDLDIFAEVAHLTMLFAEKHGERIMADLGLAFDPTWQPDIAGFKASLGVDPSVEALTYREIQDRRAKVRENLQHRNVR